MQRDVAFLFGSVARSMMDDNMVGLVSKTHSEFIIWNSFALSKIDTAQKKLIANAAKINIGH